MTVNRFWQSLFGRGLVKTAEDFGSQGTRPVYPEVLDWLALRFIESGWDTKALMKTIVMSQTYRQRSIADAKTMADDPDNELARARSAFPLAAEMIRDNALAAAGLLNAKLGGAPGESVRDERILQARRRRAAATASIAAAFTRTGAALVRRPRCSPSTRRAVPSASPSANGPIRRCRR